MGIRKNAGDPRVGLGVLPMAAEGRPDRDTALRTIRHAIASGMRLVDTADVYGLDDTDFGYGEDLVADAFSTLPQQQVASVRLATKGGLRRGDDGSWVPHGRPEYLARACRESLRRLRVDSIELYQLHRPDPTVPYEESIGAVHQLQREGLVQTVGVSNVDDRMLDLALASGPIASVQNQYSVLDQADSPMVARCGAEGIDYVAWGPLGGRRRAAHLPALLRPAMPIALAHGVTIHELVLGWLLAQGPHMIVIPGSKTPESAESALRAAALDLTPEELGVIAGSANEQEQ